MSTKQSRAILAANIQRIIDKDGSTNRGWALSKGLDVKLIERMTKGKHSFTLDKIEEVAAACGLEAWHLLLPDLEPGQRIEPPLTEADRELLQRLKHLLK